MKFSINSSLSYQVADHGTLIGSIQAMQTDHQKVIDENMQTDRPVDLQEIRVGYEKSRFLRLRADTGGPLTVSYEATVENAFQRVNRDEMRAARPAEISAEVLPYLFPSRYCESDQLRQEAAQLFGQYSDEYDQAEAVADWITANLVYSPGASGETTSAVDVFKSRAGVCRDSAHLGIALCRALTLPARYATVYAYQLSPQDFHACYEVWLGGRWCLFDGTGLAPLNGLVRIATGRDASDAAVASLFGGMQGTGVSVDCQLAEKADFEPLTRAELKSSNDAFILL